MTLEELFVFAVAQNSSDIHLQSGTAPQIRVAGQVLPVAAPVLSADHVRAIIQSIGPQEIAVDIDRALVRGADFSYSLPGVARFRCNLYSHLGMPGLAIRVILPAIRTIQDLNLPPVVGELVTARRGLVLMSGATGSGKTTTLAALVDLLNSTYPLKILTIEDPIEYEHASKKSLVSHIEVGRDTPSFHHGLRQALRQSPDVILVGELRDAESVQMALRAADTGHQVLATIHSSNAAQTVERLLAMVPPNELSIARQQFAASLVGVIAQRLTLSRHGEVWPVVEVLRAGAITSKYILENRISAIADYIKTSESGMQTFDRDILRLLRAGIIDEQRAMEVATNPEALGLEIRMSAAAFEREAAT